MAGQEASGAFADLLAGLALSGLSTAFLLALLVALLPPAFLQAGTSARSNHQQPARQIGGLALVPASLLTLTILVPAVSWQWAGLALLVLFGAGLADDWRPAGALTRLAVQLGAAVLVMATGLAAPAGAGLLPPVVLMAAAVLFLVWTVNMVNFMDGLDLMTVAGAGVPLLLLALALALGGHDGPVTVLAAAMAGGLGAFALFNRPPARVFLGDSGSLPLGLVAGIAMLELSRTAGLPAALAPFSYYFWDSLSTLLARLRDGENILASHSRHAYQRAYRAGISARRVALLVTLSGVASGLCTLTAALMEPGAGQWLAGAAGLAPGLLLTVALNRMARTGSAAAR